MSGESEQQSRDGFDPSFEPAFVLLQQAEPLTSDPPPMDSLQIACQAAFETGDLERDVNIVTSSDFGRGFPCDELQWHYEVPVHFEEGVAAQEQNGTTSMTMGGQVTYSMETVKIVEAKVVSAVKSDSLPSQDGECQSITILKKKEE